MTKKLRIFLAVHLSVVVTALGIMAADAMGFQLIFFLLNAVVLIMIWRWALKNPRVVELRPRRGWGEW